MDSGIQWRSMYDSDRSGIKLRLLGYIGNSKDLSEAFGQYEGNDKSGCWRTVVGTYFKPIGWMYEHEIPATETSFEIGKTYLSNEGHKVKIIKESYPFGHPYACVQGNDGGWRYNRIGKCELGRVTGTHVDDDGKPIHPGCLLLPSVEPEPSFIKVIFNWLLGKT